MFTPAQHSTWSTSDRPSKVTVPAGANPLAKLIFSEMARQRVTYPELEWRAGVLVSTIKSWRAEKMPGLATVEACLGALGWALVPVPKLDSLHPEIRDALENVGQYFRSEEEALGAVLATIAAWPEYARSHLPTTKKLEIAA